MVMLQLTTALETRLSSLDLPPELAALVASYVTASDSLNEVLAQSTNEQQSPRNRTIEHAVLVRVARQCRSAETSTPCTLASLLALTDIHAPPLPVREKSPELLAILADIQLNQDRAEYQRMTLLTSTSGSKLFPPMLSSASSFSADSGGGSGGDASEWKEIRRQMGAIVNVLASMATVATGVWWVGGGRSVGARLGLAMSGAAAIAAIEAFLYYRFFTRHDRERNEIARRAHSVGGKSGGVNEGRRRLGRAESEEGVDGSEMKSVRRVKIA